MNYHSTQSGYSLVEVLIAITILLLAIAGPLTIASKGLQAAYFAREQLTAFMLAQEGVEIITAIRNEHAIEEFAAGPPFGNMWDWVSDTDISDCFDPEGCNIVLDNSNLTSNITECDPAEDCRLYYSEAGGNRSWYRDSGGGADPTPFVRVIRLNETVPDQEVEVEVTVTWQPAVFGGGTPKVITLTTSLFNEYEI